MKTYFKILLPTACAVSLLMSSVSAIDELNLSGLPEYQTPIPYAGIRNWHVTQNLGPTGMRAWVYGHTNHTRDSRELLVKSVEPGSPAEGVLRPYDIIVGAAVPPDSPSTEWKSAPEVKRFDSDARLSFARAITWAESTQGGGRLKVLRNRDGEVETVTVKLPVMGDYSASAPFNCPKSELIVDHAAEFLAGNMPVEGFSAGVPQPMAAAFLLGTGDEAYLDHVRRSAYQMGIEHTISEAGHETWRWGNTNLFLCEYYLATGDKRVLPQIEAYCKVLAEGQCNPGTWGHRAVPDFIPPGYGSLNSSGVVCFLSLVLGEQCGVEVDEQALRNSIEFYGSYAGKGGIPYGDHPPAYHATSNGKNGAVAIAFRQLDATPAAQWFARLSCSANLAAFEGGHTGNYFNQTWSPLGASLAGRQNYANFWSRFNSYRDLARRRDGSFMTQPLPNKREGDLGTGSYVKKGPMWSTGGFALSYLAGTERLAILGRKDSVFAADAPKELSGALDLYHDKQFEQSQELAESIAKQSSGRVQKLATQLAVAAQKNLKSIELTLEEMKQALAIGDLYKIKCQLLGIESVMNPDDMRLREFREAVESSANEDLLAEGAKYYRAVKGVQWSGPKGFETVVPRPIADRRAWGDLIEFAKSRDSAYKGMAQNFIKNHPEVVLADSEWALLPPPEQKDGDFSRPDQDAKCWRYVQGGSSSDDDWKEARFNDNNWEATALPSNEIAADRLVRLRGTFDVAQPSAIDGLELDYNSTKPFKVYLNGTLILDYPGGKVWGRVTTIPLKASTVELLQEGTNCLAVEATNPNVDFNLLFRAKKQAFR